MTNYNRNPAGKGGFKKGQSGNPAGRPKQLAEVIASYRAETDANRLTLVEIRDNKSNSAGDRIRAVIAMENRAWGMPVQMTVNEGAQGSELEALREFLKSIDGQSRQLPQPQGVDKQST